MNVAVKGNMEEIPASEARPTDLLSADEVAELCGMTHGRVCQLLQSGEMKGTKFRGLMWQVERREAEKFREKPKGAGRPRTG